MDEWEVFEDVTTTKESLKNKTNSIEQKNIGMRNSIRENDQIISTSSYINNTSEKSGTGFLDGVEVMEKYDFKTSDNSLKKSSDGGIITDLELQVEEEQREKFKEVHQKEVAQLEDTAQLGDKVRTWGKGDKKARIEHNKSIDKAKILTNRAKEDTLNVYGIVNKLNNQYKKSAGEFNTILSTILFSLENMGEDSFMPANIKANFFEYLEIVKKFEYLQNLNRENPKDLRKKSLEKIEPLIQILKIRLQVYAESNRIKLDGTVLGEKEEGRKFFVDELNQWKQAISDYKKEQDEKDQMIATSEKEQTKDLEIKSNQPVISKSQKENLTDEDRLTIREIKSENGMREARPKEENIQKGGYALLTREQALTTESDILSQKKREQLRDMNFKLYSLGEEKTAEIINNYVIGDRYTIGYTRERKRLMKAIKAVNDALDKMDRGVQKNDYVKAQLKKIKNYFDEMTNGTLVIPEGANIEICTDDSALKEKGQSFFIRTKMRGINSMAHWCNQSNTPLFSHEPIVNDVKQRLVSNCYMLAGVTEVINVSPALLKSCLKDNGDGTVTVRLFDKKDGKYVPVYIKVKKTIPRIGRIGEADPLSAGALWMQMIEKACAFHGRMIDRQLSTGYTSLWYGLTHDFIGTLLGVKTEEKGFNPSIRAEEFYNEVKNNGKNRVYSVGTGLRDFQGLRTRHAYALLGVAEINQKKYFRVRNPYSNQSFRYENENVGEKLGAIPFSNGSDDTYGQFYIGIKAFGEGFDAVHVNDLSERLKELEEQQKKKR